MKTTKLLFSCYCELIQVQNNVNLPVLINKIVHMVFIYYSLKDSNWLIFFLDDESGYVFRYILKLKRWNICRKWAFPVLEIPPGHTANKAKDSITINAIYRMVHNLWQPFNIFKNTLPNYVNIPTLSLSPFYISVLFRNQPLQQPLITEDFWTVPKVSSSAW